MTANILDIEPRQTNPGTGLTDRAPLAGSLSIILANYTVLMHKTLGCHWNVTGPLFTSVHALTEQHYQNIFEAIDDIAERVRALGFVAPYAADKLVASAELTPRFAGHTAAEMIRELVEDHGRIATKLRELSGAAQRINDQVTDDLATRRLEFHEEALWMLRALVTE